MDIDADEKAGQAVEPAREMQVSDMVVTLGGSDRSNELAARNLTWPRLVLSPKREFPRILRQPLVESPAWLVVEIEILCRGDEFPATGSPLC